MKKFLITLAMLAASGIAMAQSSVTLFGIVDAGIADYKVSGQKNIYGMNNSGDATSRLGFRGVEDLGSGLKATFWLESPIEPDTGIARGTGYSTFAFGARSTVSLVSDKYGELRLGRDTSRSYENIALYDVFLQAGIGEDFTFGRSGSPLRYSNMVAWFSPTVGGFSGAIDYAFGGNSGDPNGETVPGCYICSAGRYVSGELSYNHGPLSVTMALEQMNGPITPGVTSLYADEIYGNGGSATAPTSPVFSKEQSAALAASYDFNVVKLSAILRQQRNNWIDPTQQQRKMNNIYLGAAIPLGSGGALKLSYNYYNLTDKPGKANQFAVGYVYSFSKRTNFYATYAYLKNTGQEAFSMASKGLGLAAGATQGRSENAFTIGIRHNF